ncbi:ROK family protein [Aeromicrobium sp. CTD01-1L150]|uniref:ROK family transcriptional regulator n=1 Tax=Aeromicrobium sp. CTD01-1L150 TaxID=3341830 RepID=UPI0035C19773
MTSVPMGAPGAGELFQHLRDGEPRTKAELGELSSLARSAIAARLEALVSTGLLRPVGEAASTGGRPPTRFALDDTAHAVLGVDLGASHAAVAVIDLVGNVRREVTVDSDIADGPVDVLDRVLDLADTLLTDLGLESRDVMGVGIGVPGPVEHSTGRPVHPPIMPGWHEFDVPGHLNQHFDGPVLVDNDVNILARGEHVGAWAHEDHLLYVKVATGIGAGIISHRHLLQGGVGTAGDLGHVPVVEGETATVCRCGNVGCLEAVAAGPAVAAVLRERGLDVHTTQEVVAAVRSGDTDAARAVREAGRTIGGVLATCVNLLNPSIIVIGGTLAAAENLVAGAREVIFQRSLPLATSNLRIVTATGDRAALVGAGAMVLEQVLSPSAVDAIVSRTLLENAG